MTEGHSDKIQVLFQQPTFDHSFHQFILESRRKFRSSEARGLCSRIYRIPARDKDFGELCIKRVEEDDQYAPHAVAREILTYATLSNREDDNAGKMFIMTLLAAFKDESDDFNPLFDLVMPWYPCTLQDILNEPCIQFVQDDQYPHQSKETKAWQIASSITPTTFAKQVAFQLFSALDFLHSNGIAHRDVKPSNILLKTDDSHTMQLIDFGTCFLSDQRYPPGDDGKGGLASEVGTGAYRAPECLLSPLNGYDPYKVDIWQAGVTLSEFFLPLQHLRSESGIEEGKDDILEWERALWSKDDDGEKFEGLQNRLNEIQGHSEDFFSVYDKGDLREEQEDNASGWQRNSLFEGDRGDLGLANSIFSLLGLPNGDAEGEALWPEAVHFQPSLSRLPFQRRAPAVGGLEGRLLKGLPENTANDLANLVQVLRDCLQLSARKRVTAKVAVDRLT